MLQDLLLHYLNNLPDGTDLKLRLPIPQAVLNDALATFMHPTNGTSRPTGAAPSARPPVALGIDIQKMWRRLTVFEMIPEAGQLLIELHLQA